MGVHGKVDHRIAGSSNSEGVSLGKGESSGHGCRSWNLAGAGAGAASTRQSWPQGTKRRAPRTCCVRQFSQSINFKGIQSWGEPLSTRGLAQEVSCEAPPLSFSSLRGPFFFSSAPETTHKGWPTGASCGVSSDYGIKAGEKGGYRGKTGSCEKGQRAGPRDYRPGQGRKSAM